MLDPALALVLIAVAFLAGVGITAIGPGGVFTIAALFFWTSLPSATIAGTASLTFVATGLLGTAAYVRSGELAAGDAREAAVVLSVASVVGVVVGVRANLAISERLFGVALGVFFAVVGSSIVYREARGLSPRNVLGDSSRRRRGLLALVGALVGLSGGLLGIGGPVLAVPLLVLLGVPMLVAVAVAQVQSVLVSALAAGGYALVGAISLPVALLIGVPQLVGAVVGWRVAHRVSPGRLRAVLGVALVALAPFAVI